MTITDLNAKIYMVDIDLIDFTMIKLKLRDKEEGQGLSKFQCNEA